MYKRYSSVLFCLFLFFNLCSKAGATENMIQPSTNVIEVETITQEIRYQTTEAGEVFLVWGINGWRTVPEAVRPPGTVMKNGGMHTPMIRDGDAFAAKVHVPLGSIIEYGFWISKTNDGKEINVWDANGYPPRYYLTVAEQGRVAVVLATIDLEKNHAPLTSSYTPQVSHEIHYQMNEAGEAFLVWGINGWQVVPEATRPSGTVLKDAVMHTPMDQKDNAFYAKVQVPSGSTINYGFLITKTRDGVPTKVWDANGTEAFRAIAINNGSTEVRSTVTLAQRELLQWNASLASYILIGVCMTLGIGVAIKLISARMGAVMRRRVEHRRFIGSGYAVYRHRRRNAFTLFLKGRKR